MANDAEIFPEHLEFHPCDTPRGMLFYKLNNLTFDQRTQLNAFKLNYIKSNQKYLKEHPEELEKLDNEIEELEDEEESGKEEENIGDEDETVIKEIDLLSPTEVSNQEKDSVELPAAESYDMCQEIIHDIINSISKVQVTVPEESVNEESSESSQELIFPTELDSFSSLDD